MGGASQIQISPPVVINQACWFRRRVHDVSNLSLESQGNDRQKNETCVAPVPLTNIPLPNFDKR
jgi:hypothetical protein